MCTNFRISATDGTVVVGRTMEFPNDMGTRITVLPVGYSGTGIGVDGSAGQALERRPTVWSAWTHSGSPRR